jgi:hypothetical protein
MSVKRAQSLGYIGQHPSIHYFGIYVTYMVFSFFNGDRWVCTIHSALVGRIQVGRIQNGKADIHQFSEWKEKIGIDGKYINTIPVLAVWTIYKTNINHETY